MKPILFNTEMVKAILDGRKTVTRRPIKSKNIMSNITIDNGILVNEEFIAPGVHRYSSPKQKYEIGDILYVRETCQSVPSVEDDGIAYVYKASDNGMDWQNNTEDWKWRPSIHMPKSAARIFLKVTDVRVEKLLEMAEKDAHSEGFSSLELFYDCW